MGKKDKGTIKETEAERQLMSIALERYQTYKQKWQPIQQRAIQTVKAMGEPGSMERGRAVTRAAGGVGMQFDEGTDQVEAASMNRGVDADSSNFRLRTEGLTQERGKATGIAGAAAESAVDNAYLEGLSSLMAMGKDHANTATRGLASSAATYADDAKSRAGVAAARRARNYSIAGQAIGMASTAVGGINAGGGKGSGFGFSGDNQAAPFTPGVDI